MPALNKCPQHPSSSGESQYGGLYCWGADRKCKWAVKQFINDTEDGGVVKVTKYHLPAPGKWLTQEDYITAVQNTAWATEPTGQTAPFPSGGADYGPDEEFQPGATSEPSEAPDSRQRSIVRQTCIKAAATSLQHGMGTPEEKAGGITHLAGALEDWVNR